VKSTKNEDLQLLTDLDINKSYDYVSQYCQINPSYNSLWLDIV